MPGYQYGLNVSALASQIAPGVRAMAQLVHMRSSGTGGGDRCPGMWRDCPGPRPNHSIRRWRTILSVSMFEPAWYLRETLDNALANTESTTLILVHLNLNTNYSSSQAGSQRMAHLEWLWAQERIEVSCFRQHVLPYSGTVLLAMLTNLLWTRCRGLSDSATHIVFQASNMWWWRPGMEAFVRARDASVPRLQTAAACADFEAAQLSDGAYQGCFGVASAPSVPKSSRLSGCHIPPFAGLQYVVVQKHEGSFFRTGDALAAVEAIFALLEEQAGTTERLGRLQRRLRPGCSPRFAVRPDIFSSAVPLEEYMLQSWVANYGRAPAHQPASARTLAVMLDKGSSRQWDLSCPAFIGYLHARRPLPSGEDLDHFALKYQQLRSLEYKPPTKPIAAIRAAHAKARASGVSDKNLPDSNILIRDLIQECTGMKRNASSVGVASPGAAGTAGGHHVHGVARHAPVNGEPRATLTSDAQLGMERGTVRGTRAERASRVET